MPTRGEYLTIEDLKYFSAEQLKHELSRRSRNGQLLNEQERVLDKLKSEKFAIEEKMAEAEKQYEKLKKRHLADLDACVKPLCLKRRSF